MSHVSQELKVKLTPEIAAQLAEKQGCIRVASQDLKPIKAGWGGALAVIDGGFEKSAIYFHEPDGFGWVHPEYYVAYVNEQLLARARTAGGAKWPPGPDQRPAAKNVK